MGALLAQPVSSVSEHTVIGVGSPSVGLLERLTCIYRRGHDPAPGVDLRVQAYNDPAAAAAHLGINVAAERPGARTSTDTAVGTDPAVLFDEQDGSVLMLADGPNSLTISLARGIMPDAQLPAILIDLAQRVLPTVTRTPPAHPHQQRR